MTIRGLRIIFSAIAAWSLIGIGLAYLTGIAP